MIRILKEETIMEKIEMLEGILNSYPYPIVFVDNDYRIRFMNKNAQYYYRKKGKNLIERAYLIVIMKNLLEK